PADPLPGRGHGTRTSARAAVFGFSRRPCGAGDFPALRLPGHRAVRYGRAPLCGYPPAGPSEPAVLKVDEGLLQLLARIHDEGSVLGDRLLQRPPRYEDGACAPRGGAAQTDPG